MSETTRWWLFATINSPHKPDTGREHCSQECRSWRRQPMSCCDRPASCEWVSNKVHANSTSYLSCQDSTCISVTIISSSPVLLLSVLWHCWLDVRKTTQPENNWVMKCWHGYLSGARCKWYAYGPAHATATPSSLASLKSTLVWLFWCWLTLGCLGKEAIKRASVCLFAAYIVATLVHDCTNTFSFCLKLLQDGWNPQSKDNLWEQLEQVSYMPDALPVAQTINTVYITPSN